MHIRSIKQFAGSPFFPLLVGEASVLYSSVFIAGFALYGSFQACEDAIGPIAIKSLAITVVMLCSLVAVGLYQFHQRIRLGEVLLRIVVALAGGSVVLAASYFWLPVLAVGTQIAIISMVYSFTLLFVARLIFARNIDDSVLRQRSIVYGAGERASAILDLRRKADRRGFKIVGQVRAPGDADAKEPNGLLDSSKGLLEITREYAADEIVIAMDDRRGNLPIRELLDCKLAGVEVIDLIEFFERESGKIRVDLVNASWLILTPGFRVNKFREFAKRALDLVVSTIGLLLSWPIILGCILAIKIEDGLFAPVFYRQVRVGHHGENFPLLKFRSMGVDAEADGEVRWAKKDDNRVTKVGALIRTLRIDEIPQLLNVFRGQMSIVGPRPERPEFVESLSKDILYYAERHSIKPGITGWAQMKYPYGASAQDSLEKLQYDLYYVKNHSTLLDLIIMLQTVEVVLWGRGAR